MALTATVHGQEVRIYADGVLVGTVEHTPPAFDGDRHELVGRGVQMQEEGRMMWQAKSQSRFAASMATTYPVGDERLTEAVTA